MKTLHSFLLLSCIIFGFIASANASSNHLSVVAVVGETPISTLDLVDRTELIIRSTGLADNAEIRQKVASQALKQLVDERLQMLEARKRNVDISGEELANAIAGVEQQNGQSAGSLRPFMERKGVAWEGFTSQLKAQLLWNKMLATLVRPKVRISEAEFARAAKNQRFVENETEYNITPLVLTIDSPAKEQALTTLARRVVKRVRGGTPLEVVMQQLMRVPPGKEPRFWVTADQLEPSLSAPLQAAKTGEVIGPIRSERGIHIMKVNEVRQKTNVNVTDPSQVVLKEVLLGLKDAATPKEVQLTLEVARQVAKNPGSCLQNSVAGVNQLGDSDIKVSFLQSTVSELPAYAAQQATNLNVGEVGEPFATPQGIRFYILCEKVELPAQIVADDTLRERLFREKMELESSKFMRALRRENFIEVRG